MRRAESIAFVSPRFSRETTIGGAETLLKHLAMRAARDGRKVRFLTTCATDHLSWENVQQPGTESFEKMDVTFFPVDDDRDLETFRAVQDRITGGLPLTEEQELLWLKNSVNSTDLYQHLRDHGQEYDKIVLGPYLYGLTYTASLIHPQKSVLIPCLHDEPFAYVKTFKKMFFSAGHIHFNTEPERDLALRLHDIDMERTSIGGIGLTAPSPAPDPEAFAQRHRISVPYIVYCGRREPMKGTPLLIDYFEAFRARTSRDIKLVMTGSGYTRLPRALIPHVLDVGMVSEREKYEAMAGAVAFCHPSINESLGIVILEAWLAGTPSIVHDRCEVLKWQCKRSNGGLWFRSYSDFEEILILLMDKPELTQQLAGSGRDYVLKEYSEQEVDKRFFRALDRK